jgi:hypothetical protein
MKEAERHRKPGEAIWKNNIDCEKFASVVPSVQRRYSTFETASFI